VEYKTVNIIGVVAKFNPITRSARGRRGTSRLPTPARNIPISENSSVVFLFTLSNCCCCGKLLSQADLRFQRLNNHMRPHKIPHRHRPPLFLLPRKRRRPPPTAGNRRNPHRLRYENPAPQPRHPSLVNAHHALQTRFPRVRYSGSQER